MSASMPDEIGLLAKVTKVLREDGVNLLAASAWLESGTAHFKMVPEDPDAARRCALKQGITLQEWPAIRVEGDDEPGALIPVVEKIAEAGVNLTVATAAAAGGKFSAILIVADADYEKACKALGI
jgi:hypothetical protein